MKVTILVAALLAAVGHGHDRRCGVTRRTRACV
jgi:hypothetical protein